MMNLRLLLYPLMLVWFCLPQGVAQTPTLPVRGTLSQSILSGKTYTNGTQTDISVLQQAIPANYTLEVTGKVNAATGRGLDIEARNSALSGFRLSLDASTLKWTSPLSSPTTLSASRAGDEQTIRIAVQNQTAHVYQNGAYLQSMPLATIRNIVNGAETTDLDKDPTNVAANWAGTPTDRNGKPSLYGWTLTNTTSDLFVAANGSGGSRYVDVTAATNPTHTSNGSTFVGRIFYIRWDNNSYKDAIYSYPVTLEANTTYDFSLLCSHIANGQGSKRVTVGIGKTNATADRYATQSFGTGGDRVLLKNSFVFTSKEAGTYYLTFTGDWGLYALANLSLNKVDVTPRFIFGKNYPTGTVDMAISSVTYDEGAYAPNGVVNQPRTDVQVTGNSVSYPATFHTNFIVAGKTDMHLTADVSPLTNSSVALNSPDAWLFFDNIRPSVVIANWLDKITINGVSAKDNPNVRVGIYKNGTVVIPNGNLTSQAALEVFNEANLQGANRTFEIETYHNNLGAFNNSIKSFKLKRGYMATLATNTDGSGFSRVFIANDADLVVNTLPASLNGTASFIRVFKWDWVSKKGKAGWSPDQINSTWYYDWNVGGSGGSNYNYSIIRQNGGWPDWNALNSKRGVNHLLGFNEPDRPDQANMTVDEAIRQWPEMMKSGLRLGSPSPANPDQAWITNFMSKCNELNYRVDYVAIHCYWGGRTPRQWYDDLKRIYDRVKRPLWITEWNNGANWTSESWPADQPSQFQKQLNDLKGILTVMDTTSFIERYAIYDWVENKRALVLGDTLTPAGKYYAANKSDFAFNPLKEYIHNWKLSSPLIYSSINNANYAQVTLNWSDLNGELGSKYILERKIDGTDADFVAVQEFAGYTHGGNMTYTDQVRVKTTYRIKAVNLDGSQTANSTEHIVSQDATPVAPTTLSGETLSASQVRLTWNTNTTARSYTLKRSLSATGPFEPILARTTALQYTDLNLTPGTTYYYAVTSLNSAGESPNSTVLTLRTNDLGAPAAVVNPRIASADSKVTLTWDFIYDAKYDIYRSEAMEGPYTAIATDLDATTFRDPNKTNDKNYYYKIVARNAVGSSPETQVLVAKPEYGQEVHIDFNENTGTLAADAWGGYNGVLRDGTTWAAGRLGANGAVALTKTTNSYVQLPAGVVSTLNNFTIATWIKLPANQGNNTRVFDFGSGTGTYMILVPRSGTNVRYKLLAPTGNDDRFIPYTIPTDQWVHLVVSQNGTTFKFYVNGSLIYTDENVKVKPSDMGVTTSNYLGKSQWPNDPYSDHQYDDFRIYNFALTDQNVQNLAGDQPLPVQLTRFTGKATAEGNLLNWHTAAEVNNDYFEVERAEQTPEQFQSIARIKGKGTTALPSEYQFTDREARSGLTYYRLRQWDLNGKSEYSRIISVDTRTLRELKLYPNPVSSTVTIELPDAQATQAHLRVYNVMGRLVLEQKDTLIKGKGAVQADLSRLPAGAYRVQVKDQTSTYSVSIIKN